MSQKQTGSFHEICAIATHESSIARALLGTIALGAFSYLPVYDARWLLAGRSLLYALTIFAFIHVIWLAAIEKSVRLPRTTLALPGIAFLAVLLLSELKAGASFGLSDTGRMGGGIAASALMAPFAYLGYLFANSRRDRRRIFVMITFLLTTAAILGGLRVWAVSLGVQAFGNPIPPPDKMVEIGLYLSFVLPMLASQSIVRRSWLTRYSPLPALAIGLLLLAVAAPPIALLASVFCSLFAPVLAGRRAVALAGSFLLVAILTSSVLLDGSGEFAGWARTNSGYAAQVSGVAEQARTERQPPVSSQGRAMGAFPIALFLGLLAAFLMQGLPALATLNDVEKSFALGTLTGLGGYAIMSIAYGTSLFSTPTIWLLIGASARLINPNPEPVLRLSLRLNREEETGAETRVE